MTEFLKYHTCKIGQINSYIIQGLVRVGKLDLVKYFLTLPDANAAHHCERSLSYAITDRRPRFLEFLLHVPGLNPMICDNDIIDFAIMENFINTSTNQRVCRHKYQDHSW
jgi:hypothetical protein